MHKVRPDDAYPPEPGCYLVGNPYSPVAVAVLLDGPYNIRPPTVKDVPPEIEALVRAGLEYGAAFHLLSPGEACIISALFSLRSRGFR